jgi:hypothetical protein
MLEMKPTGTKKQRQNKGEREEGNKKPNIKREDSGF